MLIHETINCLLEREEMEYDMPGDAEPYRVAGPEKNAPEINRFRGDWVARHLFATLHQLSEQKQSVYAFLKNGGISWARRVRHLSADTLAAAARLHGAEGGLKGLQQNAQVPQLVRDALAAMQIATADVIGTDGHRRLCRHEGVAFMTLFGAPVIFCTPNLADTKQPLLLIVQGYEIRLDDSFNSCEDLPAYRDMMRRLASDPYGQTLVFELVMRLFFLHVLGVRPECLQNRRRSQRLHAREWCTDGAAASSTAPGIFGPILAFRGEIEAQGRGSLHPHILVWLVCMTTHDLLLLIRTQPALLQSRLREWMRAVIKSITSTTQASVLALPRQYGDTTSTVPPLPLTPAARAMSIYDGGSELERIRALPELSDEQRLLLETTDDSEWLRPDLPACDTAGNRIEAADVQPAVKRSIYTMPVNQFAVSQLPSYRRLGSLHTDAGSIDARNDLRFGTLRHALRTSWQLWPSRTNHTLIRQNRRTPNTCHKSRMVANPITLATLLVCSVPCFLACLLACLRTWPSEF